jgi:F-type H+-transporting ATPase subunit alpha
MQFASDLDADTKARIESGRKYTELLKQDQHAPLPFYLQVISIYAANAGLLAGAPVEKVRTIETDFLGLMERDHGDTVEALARERALSDAIVATLDAAIATFKTAYPQHYTTA